MTEKYYQLGTHTAEQWCEIHNELIQETTGTSNIPNRCVTCVDDKPHSPTRGTFLLTDEEAEILKNDARIKFINIDYTSYPEIYKPPPEELQATTVDLLKRWQGTVKVYREFETSNTLPGVPNASDINRTGYQLLRPMQKLDPWVGGETSAAGSFDTWPGTWIKDSESLVAYVSFQFPPAEFQVTVNGPATVSVLLDPAGSSDTGNASVTTEIEILDSSDAQVQIYNNSANGTGELNPLINQTNITLPNAETYKIYYRSSITYNTGTAVDWIWAVGMNCSLGTVASGDNDVFERNVEQFGDARDVDVIVADDGGGWIGHPEFQNNCSGAKPFGYTGGNVLPGNGTCDVLDLVLDAPYYLDPTYFDENPVTRLITRWDGTRVPVETVARSWWASASNRSAIFNAQYPNVGTVNIISGYTRAYNNGSNTARSTSGRHCTPCMALSYGRTQGWAYNANKWVFNHYGANGADIEPGFDLQKIFHQTKPVNPKYGTKNPTVSSNSWGYRAWKDPQGSTWYYNHRSSTNVSYTSNAGITWLSHMGTQGDTVDFGQPRWKSEMKTNSLTTALDELVQSGVIFVVAAGNSNQKQVNSGHLDFNNYITQTNGGSLANSSFFEFGVEVTGTTNRRGFPQQGGMYNDPNTGERIYPVINIGALDDEFKTSKETKVDYSDRGEGIDVYFPADGTLSANHSYTSEGQYPDTYPGFTANVGNGAGIAQDCAFGGTSAACPVAAGFIACLLGLNRNWTWREVREYFQSLDVQDSDRFYYGVESTTATSANWTDYEGLEGGDARVGYQNNVSQTSFPIRRGRIGTGLNFSGIRVTYKPKQDRG